MGNLIEVFSCMGTFRNIGEEITRRCLDYIAPVGTESGISDNDIKSILDSVLFEQMPFGKTNAAIPHATGVPQQAPVGTADTRPAPLVLGLVGCDLVSDVSDLSVDIRSKLSLAPIVLFFSTRPLSEVRSALLKLENSHLDRHRQTKIDKKKQSVTWIDASSPSPPFLHCTWPAEVPAAKRPDSTLKASRFDHPDQGPVVLESKGRMLQLELDVDWVGQKKKTSSFKPANSNTTDKDQDKRKAFAECVQSWLEESSHRIVITRAVADRDGLNSDLKFLLGVAGRTTDGSMKTRVFWRRGEPPERLSALIQALPAESLALMEHQLQKLRLNPDFDSKPMSQEDKQKLVHDAQDGLRLLVDGQLSSLPLLRPMEKKSVDVILARVESELKQFEASLKAQTLEDLKYRTAAASIISHLGPEKDLIASNDLTFGEDFRRQVFQKQRPTYQMYLKEDGVEEIARRIHEVIDGMSEAHARLLRTYWMRFIRPGLIDQIERFAFDEDDLPVVPHFEPKAESFANKSHDRIRRTFELPAQVETSSLWSLQPVKSTFKKTMRLLPYFLTALIAFDFVDKDFSLGEALVSSLNWFNFALAALVSGIIAFNLYQSNKAERATKLETYTVALQNSVLKKLTELTNLWFDHLKAEREQFIQRLKEQIALQTSQSTNEAQRIHTNIKIQLQVEKSLIESKIKKRSDVEKNHQKSIETIRAELLAVVKPIAKKFGTAKL